MSKCKIIYFGSAHTPGVTTAVVLGTRPELIKMAPVIFALEELGEDCLLIHSGQHYDDALSENFIRDLEIKRPDHYLDVGSGTQGFQTAEIMHRLEDVLEKDSPDTVLVQGDTNTVLAGALTAVKMGIPVGHVEAGLRSNDRRMPEEYNRRVADHVAHLLFAPTPDSERILMDERVWGSIHMTGNTVIDACERYVRLAEEKAAVKAPDGDFILVTAHRAENVDDPGVLKGLVNVLVNAPLPVLYPVHPRTDKMLRRFGLHERLAGSENVCLTPPVGYFDFLYLMKKCSFILSDSGGIQEEATSPSIRKRVLVFRKSTERPEAVDAGYARVVGTGEKEVMEAVEEEASRDDGPASVSPYGDGNAGNNIAGIVLEGAQ